jgi:pSer/pThr/pTyr-binding forkhead associated (FHA) protein
MRHAASPAQAPASAAVRAAPAAAVARPVPRPSPAPAQPLAAALAAPAHVGHDPALAVAHARPAAPDFELSPRTSLECAECGTTNPRDARFCAECGQRLNHVHAPTNGVLAANVAEAVGARAAVEAPAPRGVVCPRCRGANHPDAQHCQFCQSALRVAPAPAAATERDAPLLGTDRSTLPESGEQQTSVAPRLVVISQDGSAGREYRLSDTQTDVGHDEGGVVLADDPYVSPRHARIIRRDGRVFVRDLGSVNGVYVRLRRAHRLQNADLVLLGLQVLRFEVVSDGEQGLGPAEEQGTRVFGCPTTPRYARLAQRTVEGVSRDVYYLTRNQVVLGREHGDIVFSNDAFMSRRHAVIARDPDNQQFMLRDLGSSNGTYIAIRKEQELREGDHVRIGQHLFRLDIDRRTRPI